MHGRTATETKAIKHLYVMNSVHRYMISISNQEPIIILTCIEIAGSFLQFQSTSSSAPVPVYFIQCSSSSLLHPVLHFQSSWSSAPVPSLPDPVLQFQSSWSSAPVPVTRSSPVWGSSSLPHQVLQFQSTSSSAPVPVFLIQCSSFSLPHPVLRFQS